jgi:hypothetical protein
VYPSSNNCHRKQNPSKKKKNKGPGSLTDTENKTHQKKNKQTNKGPGSLTNTENKTHKKKTKKQRSGQCLEIARTDGQTNRQTDM